MIQIGDCQIDIAGILTVMSSIGACLFAFLSWRNQIKTNLYVSASRIIPNNSKYLPFESLSQGKLSISNIGYKTTTIVDVELGIGRKKVSVGQVFDSEKILITIAPGEIKYYEYPIDRFVQYIGTGNFKPNEKIYWCVCTNNRKTFKCRTALKVSNIVYNGGNDNE